MLKLLVLGALCYSSKATDSAGQENPLLTEIETTDQSRVLQTGYSVDTNAVLGVDSPTADEVSASAELIDPVWWVLIIPGIFLIPFGMAVIWKNERKIVRMTGVLRAGKKQAKRDCSSSP